MLNTLQSALAEKIYLICHTPNGDSSPALVKALEAVKAADESVFGDLSTARHDIQAEMTTITAVKKLLTAKGQEAQQKLGISDDLLNTLMQHDEGLQAKPVVALLDFTATPLTELPGAVEAVLRLFPLAVFILYTHQSAYEAVKTALPLVWTERLEHFYKLFAPALDHEPLRKRLDSARALTLQRKLLQSLQSEQVFISYSRVDKAFAHNLAHRLKGHGYKVWIDTRELVGGTDWMDALESALNESNRLLLLVSPEALDSDYVKMEYRYFLNSRKTVIPVIVRPLDKYPPEIAVYQFVDFSDRDFETAYSDLIRALEQP